MLSLCPFDISVSIGAFVIGLSQISSFFSLSCLDNFDTNLYNSSDLSVPFITPLHIFSQILVTFAFHIVKIFLPFFRRSRTFT